MVDGWITCVDDSKQNIAVDGIGDRAGIKDESSMVSTFRARFGIHLELSFAEDWFQKW